MKRIYIAVGVISVVVLIAVIYAFTVVGSPFTRQAVQLDQTRIQNFNGIESAINTYYITNQKLPDDLSEIPENSYTKTTDPKTKKTYDYFPVTNTSYKLCTTFGAASPVNNNSTDYGGGLLSVPTIYNSNNVNTHKKGYDCLTFMVPDYYNKNNSVDFYQPRNSTPITVNVNLTYDGNKLSWDKLTGYDYGSVVIYFYDTHGEILNTIDASNITSYSPVFTNWRTAMIAGASTNQNVTSNTVTNTNFKDCTKPTYGLCYADSK